MRHVYRLGALLGALVLFLAGPVSASPSPASIRHVTQDWTPFRGLSTIGKVHIGETFGIYQDKEGFVWIGTGNGLIRYDGTRALSFRHSSKDSSSLAANIVRGIAQTPDGTVWVGTYGGGLDRFRAKSKDFLAYSHDASDPQSIGSNRIWSLHADSDGTLWVGTFDNGLDHFDPRSGKITHYRHDDSDPGSIAANRINCIFRDSKNRLWICTHDGLDLWQGEKKGFRHFRDGSLRDSGETGPFLIWSATEDSQGHIWVMSDHQIWVLSPDLSTSREVTFAQGPESRDARLPHTLRQIIVDKADNVWVATLNGLFEVPAGQHTARSFRHEAWNSQSILNNMVWCIMQDRTGLLWFGTLSGIDTLDPRAMRITYITSRPDESGLSGTAGTGLLIRPPNTAWIATQHAVQSLDTRTSQITTRFTHIDGDPTSVSAGLIESIAWSPPDGLWIGTGDGGLDRLDVKAGRITHFARGSPDRASLRNREILSLYEDSQGTLWVGTFSDGLHALDASTGGPLPSWWNDALSGALRKARILSIAPDSMGRLWVCTETAVYILDLKEQTVRRLQLPKKFDPARTHEQIVFAFTVNGQYLISTPNSILSVDMNDRSTLGTLHTISAPFLGGDSAALDAAQDAQGNIWFATYDGLYRSTPGKSDYVHFSRAQGIPFTRVDYIELLPDGDMLALGQRGAFKFSPSALHQLTYKPKIRITAASGYRGTRIINNPITNDHIDIPPQQISTTLQFSIFDYRDPSAMHYRYRLLGLDDSWIDAGSFNSATYTNLDPGEYTFQVLGADADGVWAPKSADLKITVLPPWWRTWWAYLLYTLLLVALVATYVLRQRRKLEHERAISAQLREADALKSEFVEKLKHEVATATRDLRDALEAMRIKNVELDEANRRALDASRIKSEFLSNMSHEIRTPMSGILGFLELLERTRLKPEQSGYLDAIRHSADSLLGIIDDILDLSRIEAGKLALDATAFNPRDVIEGVLELLAPIAYDKGLELVCVHELPADVILRGDPLRLRQILVNLAGNAVKYTNEGTVSLNASIERETETGVMLRVAVTDTGIGIAPQQQENLFQAFNRGDMDVTRRYRGTGLGLSICKMLIDAMHGEIRLHSTQGVGSTFEISLELPREHRAPASPEARPLEGRTTVVYDRNPVARRALINALENLGLIATETARPAEILAAVAGQDSGKASADILVVGLGTDVERDLEDIAGALAARPAKLPTLALVSTMRHGLLREIGDALGVDARPKTLRLERLNEIICALLKVDLASESPKTPRVSARTTPELGTLLKGMHILVTDDNRINRTLLVKMLSQAGADVEESADGRDAIEKSKTESFDAILMDIHMPGLSGIEVTQSIRRRNQTVAIIGVSANALPETKKTAMAAGTDDYLVKPVREAALIETILRCVQARKDRPSGPTGRLSD